MGFGFVWASYTFIYIIFIHFHLPYLKTFLFIWLHLCSVTVIFLLHLLFLPSSAFTSFHSLLFILGLSTFHIHLSLSQHPFLHTVIFIWPSLTFWKCNFIFVNLHIHCCLCLVTFMYFHVYWHNLINLYHCSVVFTLYLPSSVFYLFSYCLVKINGLPRYQSL